MFLTDRIFGYLFHRKYEAHYRSAATQQVGSRQPSPLRYHIRRPVRSQPPDPVRYRRKTADCHRASEYPDTTGLPPSDRPRSCSVRSAAFSILPKDPADPDRSLKNSRTLFPSKDLHIPYNIQTTENPRSVLLPHCPSSSPGLPSLASVC